jgi:uncharacterized membrane protein YfcA
MDNVIIVVALGAAVAGFVQGLSGFAFSLIALSFWAWVLDPRLAAVLAIFGALTGQVLAALTVRRGFDLKLLWPFLAGGLLGIPIGVALLPHLDASMFKAMLGLLLVVWCPVMLFARNLPRVTVGGSVADAASGFAGGILGGLGGLTGAIPTLWCTLRQFDKDRQRSIIQNFNLTTLAVAMVIYLANGAVTTELWRMLAIVAPAMLIPTLLGSRIYLGISEATFRKVVLTALTASGLGLLASSVPRLLS